jgi:hypothetical protein
MIFSLLLAFKIQLLHAYPEYFGISFKVFVSVTPFMVDTYGINCQYIGETFT